MYRVISSNMFLIQWQQNVAILKNKILISHWLNDQWDCIHWLAVFYLALLLK